MESTRAEFEPVRRELKLFSVFGHLRRTHAASDGESVAQSAFTNLPPELRNRIYEFYAALHVDKEYRRSGIGAIHWKNARAYASYYNSRSVRFMMPLLEIEGDLIRTPVFPLAMVSRQIREQFLSLFYNTYEIHFVWRLCHNKVCARRFEGWVEVMTNNLRHLKKLKIHIHACGDCVPPHYERRSVCTFRLDDLLPLVNLLRRTPKCTVKFEEWLLYREDEDIACHNLDQSGEPSLGFREILQRVNDLLSSWTETGRAKTKVFLAEPTQTVLTFTRCGWQRMCDAMGYHADSAIAYEDGRLVGLPWDSVKRSDNDSGSEENGV